MNRNTLCLTRLAFAFAGLGLLAACGISPRIAEDGQTVRKQTSAVNRGIRQAPMPFDDETAGSPGQTDSKAALARDMPVARRASRAWIGARMTAVQSDDVLPAVFSDNFKISFDDRATNGRVSIAVIAERLSRLTNVPVRVKQDVYGSAQGAPQTLGGLGVVPVGTSSLPPGMPGVSAGGKSPTTPLPPGMTLPGASGVAPASPPLAGMPMPSNLGGEAATQIPFRELVTDVSSVEMRWDGSLSSFLDHVTGRLNLSWSYRDGVVIVERFMTESFELAAFTGTQDYKMTLSGSNSGQSGIGNSSSNGGGTASSSLDVNESGKIAALESLKKSIEAMVLPVNGSVAINEGTGRFTITATKDVMSRVRGVLKHESEAMTRQAQIQFDVYSVTLDDIDERGVDWNVVFKNLSQTWGATIKSPASLTSGLGGNLGYTILSAATGVTPTNTQARFGDSSAMVNLLSEISDTVQYRPVSIIALNRQWGRKTNLRTKGYLSETTPAVASSVSGGGSPGLKTSSVVTGDKFLVQPAILDNGAILLKFGISLTELLGLFNVSAGLGQTFQQVQTPETSGTDDQGTIRLMPGEAMVVTGLSRRVSSGDTRTLTDSLPIAAGGSRKLGFKREDFLIVVRAVQI